MKLEESSCEMSSESESDDDVIADDDEDYFDNDKGSQTSNKPLMKDKAQKKTTNIKDEKVR